MNGVGWADKDQPASPSDDTLQVSLGTTQGVRQTAGGPRRLGVLGVGEGRFCGPIHVVEIHTDFQQVRACRNLQATGI